MKRRLIEVWWISLFAMSHAILSFHAYAALENNTSLEGLLWIGYGIAFVSTAGLLLYFSNLGRKFAALLFTIEFIRLNILFIYSVETQSYSQLPEQLSWMYFPGLTILYLVSYPTTVFFNRINAQRQGLLSAQQSIASIEKVSTNALETGLCFIVAFAAFAVTENVWFSICASMTFYITCGLFRQDFVRSAWSLYFPVAPATFSKEDASHWKSTCRALVLGNGNPALARQNLARISTQGQLHPDGMRLLQWIEWMELLRRVPSDGRDCLRRMALDFDWKPSFAERQRLSNEVPKMNIEEVRLLVEERARLIDDWVAASLNVNNCFYRFSNVYLSRITGEFYQIPEWNTWWKQSKEYWTGDAGLVALTARLVRIDADVAAHQLALKICGPAEEPLLKELTAQILFLNQMQKSLRESSGGLELFTQKPSQMLLVPELTDAVGLLHADSQLLEKLGLTQAQIARRLLLRTPLVDFIRKMWLRYPSELTTDMPWVIKTLTDKNLGVLRAHVYFTFWWPSVRESFLRHDNAVGLGLNAFYRKEYADAEQFFKRALSEQPRELSSRYNLALCLIRQHSYDAAQKILEDLTRLEPKESYWWLALGEMLRHLNRSKDAHSAFRRALELGAALPRVAWHRGVTYARDQHERDAIQQLNFVVGKNPTVSKLDSLASALESEGLWKLAVHFREEAFRRGLSNNDKDPDDPTNAEDISA